MPELKPSVKELRKIGVQGGDVWHVHKLSEDKYGTEEVYISWIQPRAIKGWKMHTRMWCRFVVPVGAVKVYITNASERTQYECYLSSRRYVRLDIPPMYWVAFEGCSEEASQVINIASIEHDPEEAVVKQIGNTFARWRMNDVLEL